MRYLFDLDLNSVRTILVYVADSQRKDELDWNVQEISSLATSAGMRIISVLFNNRMVFNSKYLIGIGKVLELKQIVSSNAISIVLFSHIISARQERNLTHLLQCKIIDRNQLILNIFAQRARTYEGKLQVKLAYLRYLNSRLTHEWSHLERQKGGIGLRSGPGEMQLEHDRRILRKNIVQTVLYLKKIENQREQNRKNRYKIGIPTVSLVGYTNAGKSTLFNVLTASQVYTSEKLFATLDPTFRRVTYKGGSNIILVDTVGFIQNLPNDLLSSFRATLKETMESRLLLHVIDAASENCEKYINSVHDILNSIKIKNVPIVLVMNKIDKLSKVILPHVDRDNNGRPWKIWISAQNRMGLSLLMNVLNELLLFDIAHYELRFPKNENLFQKLYQLQVVQKYWIEDDNSIRMRICLSSVVWKRLLKQNKSLINYVI